MSGYRGSDSASASAYKKAGHKNEDVFGQLIGGSNSELPPQGKTDWIDNKGLKYSVKRGFNPETQRWTTNWQVFLYGISRLKSDAGFIHLGKLGKLLIETLSAFPGNSEAYGQDKHIVKECLSSLPKEIKGNERVSHVASSVGMSNVYLSSKNKLKEVTGKLLLEFSDQERRAEFFRKSFFNGTEVDFLVVNENGKFLIYPREDVVEILSRELEPHNSKAGGRSDDLNIAGQKLLFKLMTNIGELEVRNEPSHYRELKLNFRARATCNLLKTHTHVTRKKGLLYWRAINEQE